LFRLESDAARDITDATRKPPVVINAPESLPPPC
jgi:hypothetical protein